MKKYREKRQDLYMIFIDLEEAYDRVLRKVLWWVLEKKMTFVSYINMIRDMYNGAITSM